MKLDCCCPDAYYCLHSSRLSQSTGICLMEQTLLVFFLFSFFVRWRRLFFSFSLFTFAFSLFHFCLVEKTFHFSLPFFSLKFLLMAQTLLPFLSFSFLLGGDNTFAFSLFQFCLMEQTLLAFFSFFFALVEKKLFASPSFFICAWWRMSLFLFPPFLIFIFLGRTDAFCFASFSRFLVWWKTFSFASFNFFSFLFHHVVLFIHRSDVYRITFQ